MTFDEVKMTFEQVAECDITKWEAQDQLYFAMVCTEWASKIKPLVEKYHPKARVSNDTLAMLKKLIEEEHKNDRK